MGQNTIERASQGMGNSQMWNNFLHYVQTSAHPRRICGEMTLLDPFTTIGIAFA